MKWGAPSWLGALFLVPVLAWIFAQALSARQKNLGQWIDSKVWPRVFPELDWSLFVKKNRLWLAAFFFIILALARPQWGTREETVRVRGLDVVFLLDLSNSMEVEDVVPSRLKKAKHFLKTLVERLKGDRVGVVVFAGSAFPASPLTTDLGYVLETIDILDPRMIQNQGTDLGTGLEVAFHALERGAEDLNRDASASRAIILISDGEDHEDQAKKMAEKISTTGTKLFVLGVGTEKGGPIPVRDADGELHGYKRDGSGTSIISSFRAGSLKKIAEDAHGKYWDISPAEGEVDELAGDLGRLGTDDREERRKITYVERYQWPLAIGIILLFLELFVPSRRNRALVAMVLGLLIASPAAHADWKTFRENEAALKAMKESRLSDAREHLGTAQAQAPDVPELLVNQGHLQLLEKKPEEASRSFEAGGREAVTSGKAAIAARSFYNAGVVATEAGRYNDAVQNYMAAITQAQQAKDAETEKEARENLMLLKQQREKQKQQDQDQKEKKKEQDQKDQQDKKDQGEPKDDEKKDKELEDPKKSRDRAEQKFQSQKMTKEDAEKVMAELSSREKELQRRLKKQKGQGQPQGKDW